MSLDPPTAQALEAALAAVPGVVGAVLVDGPDPSNESEPLEVQVFVEAAADRRAVGAALERAAGGLTGRPLEVVLLTVASVEPPPVAPPAGDRHTPARGRGRPRLVSVAIDSSVAAGRHEALVALQDDGVVSGRAVVDRDPLVAVVEAACDALASDGRDRPEPRAVEQVHVGDLEVVLVAVTIRGRPLLGSAVLDDEPVTAAAVRATLDAVNRWYGLG